MPKMSAASLSVKNYILQAIYDIGMGRQTGNRGIIPSDINTGALHV
jgi:hypothetical protein